MNKIEDIDIINYMINKGATAKETAEYFNISLSTVKKRLANIKDSLNSNSLISEELRNLSEKNQNDGRKKGGQSHNSGPILSQTLDEIAIMAMQVIANDMTLEEAEIKYNIPHSTLYDHFKLLIGTEYNYVYEDLETLFSYHKDKKISFDIINILNQKYSLLLNNLSENKKK